MPRITVDGVDELSFPVPISQIEALIELAERAPFGKGTETLTDPTVRDCWQIDASQIRVTGRGWSTSFKKIIELVTTGLGMAEGQLGAELYKLLVYRKGGFFAAHRDTEKISGMVATLSISLPTSGEGGELVIRHAGEETTCDMNAQEPSELSFAAFYADCLHEATPVTKGHRISLVYNLFMRSGNKWTGAPDYSSVTDRVTKRLSEWHERGNPEKLIWLLDHSYSQEGLSFDTLKGIDAAVAGVLGKAVDAAGCSIHLAILHIQEVGDPELELDFDGWGVDAVPGSRIEEVHERVESLEDWMARDGSSPNFGSLPMDRGEFLSPEVLDELEPDDEFIEDYQGNVGPTLELIYRVAALVIWPKNKTVSVLASGGIERALAWVATQKESATTHDMRDWLIRLSELWPIDPNHSSGDARTEMLRLFSATENVDVAIDFLERVILQHYDGSENVSIARLITALGPDAAEKFIKSLVEEFIQGRPEEILSLFKLIGEELDSGGTPWREIEQRVAQSAISHLGAGLEVAASRINHSMDLLSKGERSVNDHSKVMQEQALGPASICNLFELTLRLGLVRESVQMAHRIAEYPDVVTPDRCLPSALADLYRVRDLCSSKAYKMLWRQSTDFLLHRSSVPPAEPSDWTIKAEIPCESALCSDLKTFCLDPKAHTGRFRVVKDERRRLRDMIDRYSVDIDYMTERKGSPYSLVCTKNRASHKRRLSEYSEDLQYIGLLSTIAPRDGGDIAEMDRVRRLKAVYAPVQNSKGQA